jgi:hypothetical protein
MKFSMDVIPLEATPYSYFQFLTNYNTNMADERICEVWATLAPLNIGQYNDVW